MDISCLAFKFFMNFNIKQKNTLTQCPKFNLYILRLNFPENVIWAHVQMCSFNSFMAEAAIK